MKGIILAGGFGVRLRPLTHIVNKHLLPVYDRPMVMYPLATLKKSGIKDILLVSEESQIGQFSAFLKTGAEHGLSIDYASQHGAGGIAQALSLAKDFVRGDNCAVMLGDNIFEGDFPEDVKMFRSGAKIFLKKVPDPHRFGVPIFENEKIKIIEEKPKLPRCDYAVTGFYLFDNSVFSVIDKLTPSHRGELEITDAVNFYAAKAALGYSFVDGFWSDAGTFESLLASSLWVADTTKRKSREI